MVYYKINIVLYFIGRHELSQIIKKDYRPLIIAGSSGVGKGTVIDHLTSPKSSLFRTTVSCTTREKRPEEVHGTHYYFVSDVEFEQKIQAGKFLEYEEVHGYRYGTLRLELDRLKSTGLRPVIEIDIKGALELLEIIKDGVFIFLNPPSMHELERRLRGRGTESEAKIIRRLSIAITEKKLASAPPFVHVTNGKCVYQTVARIVRIWRTSK